MRSVCVYCGSNDGNRPEYVAAARALGRALAQRGIDLIYGGAQVGLMGHVANAALEHGGRVIGVIPQMLVRKEIAHAELTALHVTASMHERKQKMADLSEGFIALPGGIGTFEELFEIWTWAQLGLHRRPCGLLNVAGYYDDLVRFLDHATSSGFIRAEQRGMLCVEREVDALLARFETYAPPAVEKWLRREET
jgi:uncharacterized protein (TIGR00730 family)